MIVKKILNSQRKSLSIKQPYKRPVYKSYRDLLQLDKPKKVIVYQSQSQQQDFLQKLLNQEMNKKKKKKKLKSKQSKILNNIQEGSIQGFSTQKIRKSNSSSQIKQSELQKQKPTMGRNNSLKLSQIKEEPSKLSFLTNKDQINKNSIKQHLLQQIGIKPNNNKINSIQSERRQTLASRNTIYVDNNSNQNPLLARNSHAFITTFHTKSINPYIKLLQQKYKFMHYIPKQETTPNLIDQQINHCLSRQFRTQFTYQPNIEPLNAHWRANLIIDHSKKPQKHMIAKKQLFRNKQEEQKFIKSLRQLSKFKR